MCADARDDVGEPRLRLDVVEDCRPDERIEGSGAGASEIAAGEQPVFPADGHRPDLVLCGIVRYLEPAVIEIAGERVPPRSGVADRGGEIALAGDHFQLRVEPGFECVDFRLCHSLSDVAPHLRWFTGDRPLDIEQGADAVERFFDWLISGSAAGPSSSSRAKPRSASHPRSCRRAATRPSPPGARQRPRRSPSSGRDAPADAGS